MSNQVSIFEDVDYIKLRERIQNIETVDEALALLDSLNTTYQLSLWAVVDIIHHFQQYHPNLLPSLESGLILVLNFEPPQVSQMKRVATVFGDVSKRFPALSFTHHTILAYAAGDFEWEEVVRIAKEAEYNAWGTKELRYRIAQLKREKLLKKVEEKGAEALEEKKPGRRAKVVEEVRQEVSGKHEHEVEPTPEVDLKKEVELREAAKEEEKKRILTDAAIRAADAYMRYKLEFLDYLLEALTTNQWDFYSHLTLKMKKRLPMVAAAGVPVSDICHALSSLLDLLLEYGEGETKTDGGKEDEPEEL
jgi:hypothetical protein